jgi:molybdopterin synthase sulfur carrier subunit
MSIKFKIPKLLQDKTDDAVLVEVQGDSVQACIADLIHRYPGLEGMILDGEGRLFVRWMICIDNQSTAASNELSYQVKDGDIITLLPMVAGG